MAEFNYEGAAKALWNSMKLSGDPSWSGLDYEEQVTLVDDAKPVIAAFLNDNELYVHDLSPIAKSQWLVNVLTRMQNAVLVRAGGET